MERDGWKETRIEGWDLEREREGENEGGKVVCRERGIEGRRVVGMECGRDRGMEGRMVGESV